MSAIEMTNLTKVFKGKHGKMVNALLDLSLNIHSGEIFGFLGPNGAGKSTTIKILMGMIRATRGEGRICGISATDPAARRKVGYLPENPAFYDFLTAREYLHFVGRAFNMENRAIEQEAVRVLDLLDLSNAADRPIRGYSKGMVQRLGLAQTLLHDPDVYILDEPMSGLDPIGRALVKDIIKGLKGRGKTVFFSTHITSDVEIVCDRVGIIVGGVLEAVNEVEELLRSGIEGYFVLSSDCPAALLADFAVSKQSVSATEVYVQRERYQEFMEKLFKAGGKVELVEPKRKNLEAFFLDIVKREADEDQG